MLEGLDKVEWQNLRHAYGPATDVPGLLRQLVTEENKEARSKIWMQLYGTIWHQGDVYQATPHVVPFFLELLQYDYVLDKNDILDILRTLLGGNPWLTERHSWMNSVLEKQGRDFQTEIELAKFYVQQVLDAVREGIGIYLELLENNDATVRIAAIRLLSQFKEYSNKIAPRFSSWLTVENDISVEQWLVIGLGNLVDYDSVYPQMFEDLISSAENYLVRISAAESLARIAKEKSSPEMIKVLLDAALIKSELKISIDNRFDILAALTCVGQARGIPAMIKILSLLTDEDDIQELVEALLDLSFGGKQVQADLYFTDYSDKLHKKIGYEKTGFESDYGNETIPVQSLTDNQKMALSAIVDNNLVWEIENNVYILYGLPASREELRELLQK